MAFLDAASAPTFTFTHGDGWTTGGAPLRVDSRADWLATVARPPYGSRVLDSVRTEVHGDVVITYGRYVARFKAAAPGRRLFTVWYQRVYAKRDGKWQYLVASHGSRTHLRERVIERRRCRPPSSVAGAVEPRTVNGVE